MKYLKAADLFDELNPEEERKLRKFSVDNDGIEDLIARFVLFLKVPYKHRDTFFESVNEYLPPQTNPKQLEKLCHSIAQYQDEEDFAPHAGIYLSGVAYHCPLPTLAIVTSHLAELPDYIGLKNTHKKLIIQGSAGDNVGYLMNGGNIALQGNAGRGVGRRMKRGTITIDQDADALVGSGMTGGSITINGNVYNRSNHDFNGENEGPAIGINMQNGTIHCNGDVELTIGPGMNGGTIHLNADYKTLARSIKKGNISHKGQLIVKDGVTLI